MGKSKKPQTPTVDDTEALEHSKYSRRVNVRRLRAQLNSKSIPNLEPNDLSPVDPSSSEIAGVDMIGFMNPDVPRGDNAVVEFKTYAVGKKSAKAPQKTTGPTLPLQDREARFRAPPSFQGDEKGPSATMPQASDKSSDGAGHTGNSIKPDLQDAENSGTTCVKGLSAWEDGENAWK